MLAGIIQKLRFTGLTVFFLLILPVLAQAGFEWVPPPAPPAEKPQNTKAEKKQTDQRVPIHEKQQSAPSHAMKQSRPLPLINKGGSPQQAGETQIRVITPNGKNVETRQDGITIIINPNPQEQQKSGQQQARAQQTNRPERQKESGAEEIFTTGRGQEAITLSPWPEQTQPQQAQTKQRQPVQALSFENVAGFGSDMPLAYALRQVVPPEYAFSFGADVNPGYRVSWSGGKPWNEVVSDMVAPLNLKATVHGSTVYIQNAG